MSIPSILVVIVVAVVRAALVVVVGVAHVHVVVVAANKMIVTVVVVVSLLDWSSWSSIVLHAWPVLHSDARRAQFPPGAVGDGDP